jgi:ubiquitin-conjugating enzyme E2 Q
VIADDYRPGIIRLGTNNFVLSVSLPIVSLAKRVSPRVLMAWDRRILARTQHLTLVISGLRGIYPILKPNGSYRDDATRLGAVVSFKVGLTQRYKPSKKHAAILAKSFGLVVPEEILSHESVHEAMPQDLENAKDDSDDPSSDKIQPPTVVDEQTEENDTGRFEGFSLSASLESLLENRFIHVLQLRIKFKLGWAGAEALLAELETLQRPVDEIFPSLKQTLHAVDRREQTLAESYILPSDPLKDRDENEPLNLPQLAFSYLLRRIMVCIHYSLRRCRLLIFLFSCALDFVLFATMQCLLSMKL